MEYYVSTALSHDRGEGAEPGCGFLPLGVELKTVSEDPELVGLSDGLFTLPFLKQSKEDSTGLYASGFQVEDLASVQQKAGEGGQASPQSELQVADSDRNLIDLTIKDFGVAAEKTRYPIRHIALYTADPNVCRISITPDSAVEITMCTDQGASPEERRHRRE